MAAFEPFIPRGDNASPSLQQRRRFWRLLQSSPFVQILGSKKTTFLLAVGTLFIIIIGLFKFRPQKSEGTPCFVASPLQNPSFIPAVQLKAKSQLDSFCKATLRGQILPPVSIELEWTQTGKLQDMAVRFNEASDTTSGSQTSQGGSRLAANPSDQNAVLIQVSGVRPYNVSSDPYSIYAFRVPGSVDIVSNDLMNLKQWEQVEVFAHVAEMDKFARDLDVPRSEVYFVDIGANLGTFTLGVAAAGFNVIAIEAMSVNQFALSMSLCANKGMSKAVTLLSVALGKEDARCTVFSARTNVLDGTMRCDEAGEKQLLQQGMVKRQVVDVARLDDLLEEWLPALKNRVGALKMDTEGFEPWVIQGGKKFFSTVRPRFMQLEVSQMSDAATGVSSVQMLDALAGLGYEISLQPNGAPITPQLTIRPASTPGNVYLYRQSYGVPVSNEAIDRLEFDKYAEEYTQ